MVQLGRVAGGEPVQQVQQPAGAPGQEGEGLAPGAVQIRFSRNKLELDKKLKEILPDKVSDAGIYDSYFPKL
jgi:hypothetical protein